MVEQREMSESEKNHPDNVVLKHEGWDTLKDKKRGMTDRLFILLLVACWIAMTIVGFIVTGVIKDERLPAGNPPVLTNSIDYNGDICGVDKAVKNLPNAYYMADTSVVCVKKCPSSNDFNSFICQYDVQAEADSDATRAWKLVNQYRCMYQIDTFSLINRCWPDGNVASLQDEATASAKAANVTLANYASYDVLGKNSYGANWYTYFMSSMLQLWPYVVGFGFPGAVIVSFGYLYFMGIPGLLFSIIWGAILITAIFLFVGSWLLWGLANNAEEEDASDEQILLWKIFAYTGMALFILYILTIIVMRKRIQMAIGVCKQTCRALAQLKTIVLLPLIQAFGIFCFLCVWLVYLFYLASSGEVTVHTAEIADDSLPASSYKSFEYTENTRFAFLYLLFCWFWTSEFIIAYGQMVIALAFACWYFTRDKSKLGNETVVWAGSTAFYKHLGTCAYGSLVIAIIKTIRAIIFYLHKKFKDAENQLAVCILKVVDCCMWCVEKCMKFLSKHAYIITAIYSYSFCKACRVAFFTLLRNILRIFAVNLVSSFVLFLGKTLVPVVTTFLCYLLIVYTRPNLNEVNGLIGPLVFVFILSWWIAGMFMSILDMGIETIVFCYIADEEMFSVDERFCDGELRGMFQKTQKQYLSDKKKASAKVAVDTDPVEPFDDTNKMNKNEETHML